MQPKRGSKLRRLPEKLVHQIISFFFEPNVSVQPQQRSQESYKRLWTTIFKSEKWLLQIMQKYNLRPVLIGFRAPSVGQKGSDDSEDICLMLKILGQPVQFKEKEMKLFLSCLRGYEGPLTMSGLKLRGGIALHMCAVGGNSENEFDIIPAAWQWKSKLFNLDYEPISTYYSFYGSNKVQALGSKDIKISETSFDLKLSHGNDKLPAKIRFSRASRSA